MKTWKTVGNVNVKQRAKNHPEDPLAGDIYYDDDQQAFFIYYGDGVGWLQISREDLLDAEGC